MILGISPPQNNVIVLCVITRKMSCKSEHYLTETCNFHVMTLYSTLFFSSMAVTLPYAHTLLEEREFPKNRESFSLRFTPPSLYWNSPLVATEVNAVLKLNSKCDTTSCNTHDIRRRPTRSLEKLFT